MGDRVRKTEVVTGRTREWVAREAEEEAEEEGLLEDCKAVSMEDGSEILEVVQEAVQGGVEKEIEV
jgi:uncharacterized Zn ribbon protein